MLSQELTIRHRFHCTCITLLIALLCSVRLRSLKKMIEQREGTVREKERLTQQLKEKEEPHRTKRLGKIPYPHSIFIVIRYYIVQLRVLFVCLYLCVHVCVHVLIVHHVCVHVCVHWVYNLNYV